MMVYNHGWGKITAGPEKWNRLGHALTDIIGFEFLSTFFGFGVLVFSKTVAMFSIGFVITLGILSIFILLYAKILPLKLSGGKKEN